MFMLEGIGNPRSNAAHINIYGDETDRGVKS